MKIKKIVTAIILSFFIPLIVFSFQPESISAEISYIVLIIGQLRQETVVLERYNQGEELYFKP